MNKLLYKSAAMQTFLIRPDHELALEVKKRIDEDLKFGFAHIDGYVSPRGCFPHEDDINKNLYELHSIAYFNIHPTVLQPCIFVRISEWLEEYELANAKPAFKDS